MKEYDISDLGQFIGSRIKSVEFKPQVMGEIDSIFITLHDDSVLRLYDDGQSCCEHRYMEVQSDLQWFENAMFLDAKVVSVHSTDEDDYGFTEVHVLNIFTSVGVIVVVNYNSHNGYYGGFSMRAFHYMPGEKKEKDSV